MDPLDNVLKRYEELDIYDEQSLGQKILNTKVVIYYNLIIDYSTFSHPGEDKTIERFNGQSITDAYQSKQHSFNANLLLCHHAIGKIIPHHHQLDGKSFYDKMKNCQKNKKHQEILAKMNFSRPLAQQMNKLSAQQFNLLASIPKLFKNPDEIFFKEGKVAQFLYCQHFWLSFAVFMIQFTLIVAWIISNHEYFDIFKNFPCFLMGAVIWTLLQYYFHRFPLHEKIQRIQDIKPHMIHHAFPNLKYKVALAFYDKTYKIILLAFLGNFFIDKLSIALFFAGFIITMSLYDQVHYYCHFGPNLNIPWLKRLKLQHLKHHYRDNTRFFGVTSPIWDIAFGTYEKQNTKS